jgi:SAM-dependent methyltransferase
MTDYEKYWDRRLAKGHYQFGSVHEKTIAIVHGFLGDKRGVILECGVGPGHVYRELSKKYEVHGIEISGKAFQLYDFDTTNILKWDLNDGLPAYEKFFDVIIMGRILHHLHDPRVVLTHARSRLASGGILLAIIPNIFYYKHRLNYLFGRMPRISQAHVNFHSGPEFQAEVESVGFKLVRLTTPKRTMRARLWPTLFSQDLFYIFQTNQDAA